MYQGKVDPKFKEIIDGLSSEVHEFVDSGLEALRKRKEARDAKETKPVAGGHKVIKIEAKDKKLHFHLATGSEILTIAVSHANYPISSWCVPRADPRLPNDIMAWVYPRGSTPVKIFAPKEIYEKFDELFYRFLYQ